MSTILRVLLPLLVFGNIAAGTQAQTRQAAPLTIYVSFKGKDTNTGLSRSQAFGTLARAQAAVREQRAKGSVTRPVTVAIEAGSYFLDKPLVFTPDDSGTEQSPVTYTSQNGKVLIHGGRQIRGWKPYQGNIYMTQVPEVKEGGWKFRQLYVNGALRQRARIPNTGFKIVKGFPDGGAEVHYHTDSQRFEYAKGDLDPTWKNLEDVEVIVYHFWTDSHLPIQSLDTTTNIVTFKHKAGKVFTDDFSSNGARYVVENVMEGLDQPGEWYLDRKTGTLYYIPMPGEDMSKAEVIAPVTEKFITFQGDAQARKYIEHLHFKGLDFMYTNWDLPPGNSNDNQGSASVPASISLTGTRHTTFSNCTIRNIGTFAFEIGSGSSDNAFTHNEIAHIAAGGFRINGGTEADHPLLRTGRNTISDNDIHHYGEVFPSAVGILLMHTFGNRIAHNNINNGWYTGISIGWRWGYQPSVSRDNVIEFNHIHTIGQGLLSDMGAIYTLGLSPGTVLRNNLIHDVDANHYGGWGIYNDEGSTHLLVENNIVYNTKFAGYNIHYAKEITVRNNIFALGRLEQISRTRQEPHRSVFFENNIIYWK
ncbi:right-handed parallel beta-helix repeat-containing protein [Telluribacter sp. SYSU D00476]|uniref:right-handed parallel beta-helix repeat-containing protein n=1 Tax=Telluribacter sp. SYSU D00476 TaxID=2811430 RepID=UPI001FF57E5C|nr:right-handed parallel beta-helix repeat-containing protein [Telluribacter sp. SYSU D00476]